MAKVRKPSPKLARRVKRKAVKRTRRAFTSSDAIDLRSLAAEIRSILRLIERVAAPSSQAIDLRDMLSRWLDDIDRLSAPTGLVSIVDRQRDRDLKEHLREQTYELEERSGGGAQQSGHGSAPGLSGHGSGGGGLD